MYNRDDLEKLCLIIFTVLGVFCILSLCYVYPSVKSNAKIHNSFEDYVIDDCEKNGYSIDVNDIIYDSDTIRCYNKIKDGIIYYYLNDYKKMLRDEKIEMVSSNVSFGRGEKQ